MSMSVVGDKLEDIGKQDFHQFFSRFVNKDTDNLVLAGEVAQDTFEEFEYIAFQNYSENDNLRVYAHSDYQEAIADSDKVNGEAVEFFDSSYSSIQAIEMLSESKLGDRSIFVVDSEYKDELRSWIENGQQDIVTIYE